MRKKFHFQSCLNVSKKIPSFISLASGVLSEWNVFISEGNARVIFKELVVFMLCHKGEKVIHHGRKRSQNVIIEGFVLFYILELTCHYAWKITENPFFFSPPNIMSERQTQIFTRRTQRFYALCDQ